MKILIVAEHNNDALKLATHHAVTAANELSQDIDILVFGFHCESVANQAAKIADVKNVLYVDNEVYEHALAENCAPLIAEIGKNYNYILAGATTYSKNILPRAAALLDVSMVSDVQQILSPNTFVRPIYAGNAFLTLQLDEPLKILSIRTTAFRAAKEEEQNKAIIRKVDKVLANQLSQFQEQSLTQSKRPELTQARVIISGGRGLKSAENFHLIEDIADCLGAAVGASRAAVDAGFAPNDYQVGQTGKVVAPDLYIAVGISGAIQHLAGMKDSKVIVAINNDPDAPIFQVSDYGLVGDLFKILPELYSELAKNIT